MFYSSTKNNGLMYVLLLTQVYVQLKIDISESNDEFW
jgi:hypothetical protein